MKVSADLVVASPPAWVSAVMDDFDTFLQDHADCERKASAMAMSFVAKYPDRTEIIPLLIETAIEELEHFQEVYTIMEQRGISLPQGMPKDPYIQQLLDACRSGREDRFMDRMLLASVVECRGAERFRMIYHELPEGDLKRFYHKLWASEAKHGEIFVRMLFNYFEPEAVYQRLGEWVDTEGEILRGLAIRPALH